MLKCPKCGSPQIEYISATDSAHCLNCSVVIWDKELLAELKLLISQLNQKKQLKTSQYADGRN